MGQVILHGDRRTIAGAIKTLAPIARKSMGAAQRCIRVEPGAEQGECVLTAYNLAALVRVKLEHVICGEAFLLPPAFADMICKSNAETLICGPGESGTVVNLSLGSLEASFPVIPVDQFVGDADQCGDAAHFTVQDAPAFIAAMAAAAHAANTSEQRPAMRGIRIFGEDRTVFFAGTDGKMLVEARYVSDAMEERFSGCILHAEFVPMVRSMFEKSKTLDVSIGEHFAMFAAGGVSLQVGTIKVNYPNYRQVMPQSFRYSVTADAAAINAACEIAGAVGEANAEFHFLEGRCEVSTEGSSGKVRESFPVSGEIEDISLTLGIPFVRRCIGAVGGGRVEIKLNDIYLPLGFFAGNVNAVLMPIRANVEKEK